ncbi:Ca-activated chloride channel family protein [Filimonas lacunae]|uniref:Ca-activated chloride channel family protein n=1 Tax=Filimonas lacunae TaxID=477680 RepID=A0A173MAJ6_9BACT|nr:VWA domain-containing protein [Filimonas lacunae]BAV04540.1 Von Willebrand factor type A domain protein [Filimonas lacunae]SIT31741.1 Ca-activated chloride channel family protein [Filimonas lacunae]
MKYASPLLLILLLLFAFKQQDTWKLSGKVTDAAGKPLTGVSVSIKGSKKTVLTDNIGAFAITTSVEKPTVIFSYIGYVTQEVAVTSKKSITVVMQPAEAALDEVVVVERQPQVKKDVKGSIQRLQGRVPGLKVEAAAGTASYFAIKSFATSPVADKENVWYNPAPQAYDTNGEGYSAMKENDFLKTGDNPLSTFSIDVDAASYSNIRRFITDGMMPPTDAVRVEEMINYFTYHYPQPADAHPFSVNTEIATCPWNSKHRLALIGLQGKLMAEDKLPASNLVFLIDVSGSMEDDNKLPLVKSSLELLTDKLRPQDKVAIVTYAGNAGLVLPSTSGDDKLTIKKAIKNMSAGGSTAGGQGIELAYKVAMANLVKEGNNRIILCTDGDFNVGASSEGDLIKLIEKEREKGIFLTVLGYGMGNYQDSKMQQLADKGNGNHAYIDGISEAQKVLVHEFGGTLFTIAKDVKLQVEFNPAKVKGYRLIGYENRVLAKEDFNNDKKDAGELGSGHTVTALYEIIPIGVDAPELDSVDKLRYQPVVAAAANSTPATVSGEVLNIKLRYKQPDGNTSRLLEKPVLDNQLSFEKASENLRFAAAVAAFGMKLRESKYAGSISYKEIAEIAEKAKGEDKEKYRTEFIGLVKEANNISRKADIGDRR